MSTRTNTKRSTIAVRIILAAVGLAAAGGAVIGGRAALDGLRDDDVAAVEESTTNVSVADVRDLTETFTATGTLQYEAAIDITAPSDGTVLRIVEVGSTLRNGDVIALVDDRAVVWLDGAIPAWRALAEGDEGADVLQLETALTALGFNGDNDVTVDEEYTSATSAMVADWQASIGVETTGRVEAGTVVFGGDRTRVASTASVVGDSVSAGSPLVAIGTTRRTAVLEATPSEAATLELGRNAQIELRDGTEIQGTVAAVLPGSETWQITVEFTEPVDFPTTDVTNVELAWTHEVANDVLTVPSSALLRLDDGSYVVECVTDDTRVRTPVTVGVAIGTRVQIVSGLEPGATVITL